MLGMAPGGHFRGEGMFSHAPSVTECIGSRSLNSKAQLWMTFPLSPSQGELVSTPQNHSSLPQPTQARCCSVRKESRVSQL